MEKDMVSVVILHYRQKELIYTSIDSVLKQDYSNIELIFADDCSGDLSKEQVLEYIEENKSDNIKSVVCQFNENNMGTIKNINKSIDNAKGKYILFFAADDSLYSDDSISKMVCAIEALPEDADFICGQSIMMDDKLQEKIGKFVPESVVEDGNSMTAKRQHTLLLFQCAYAMGATLFKKSCFESFGKFDENYKVIEDWNFYLDYTKAGNKIYYVDIPVLKHRSGGISENGKNRVLSKIYSDDINKIYLEKVLPYIKDEKDIDRRRKIVLHYRDITDSKSKLFITLLKNPSVCMCQLKKLLFRR